MATGQDDLQKQIDDLKKQKEQLEAEKAKLESAKAVLDAQRALEQAKSTSNQQLAELQNQKSVAEANKALIEANRALAESQKALEQAKDASSTQLNELQNQKALADAQKALAESQRGLEQAKGQSAQQLTDVQAQKSLADAQKALSESQTQAAIAKYIGDVKAGPYSGSIDLKPNAGTEEALLLGARAVKLAAGKVADAVNKKTDGKITSLHVFAAKEFPNFQRLLNYRFRKELVKQAFVAAGLTIQPMARGVRDAVATPAMFGAGLDAFSKLLGFFKSDYTLGGIDVKLEDSLLIYALAGKLTAPVHLPLVYSPLAQNGAIAFLAEELSELVELRGRADSELQTVQQDIADFEQHAKDSKDESDATTRAELKSREKQLTDLIALYDTFAGSLTTPESNGTVPISVLVQEYAIDKALHDSAAVLLLRLENSGGGYLLKKNLWTGLGAMPLYHMGGATVSFLLLAGQSGTVLASDVFAVHGGFIRTDELKDVLDGRH